MQVVCRTSTRVTDYHVARKPGQETGLHNHSHAAQTLQRSTKHVRRPHDVGSSVVSDEC